MVAGRQRPDRTGPLSSEDQGTDPGNQKSARLNTAVLDHVAAHIRAGMSTAEIDRLVYDFTTSHGGIPAPLNYEGFPKSVCTSINDVICHGIPDENEILQDGDIVNVDVSTILTATIPTPPACS